MIELPTRPLPTGASSDAPDVIEQVIHVLNRQSQAECPDATFSDDSSSSASSAEESPPANASKNDRSKSEPSNSSRRRTIDDEIARMQIRSETAVRKMPRIYDPKGDTCVYIAPPDKAQSQLNGYDYTHYTDNCGRWIEMDSEKLRKASPYFDSKIKDLHRMGDRCPIGPLPAHIYFFLDLTPPESGDDAAYLLTALDCPEGIRFWSLASSIWNISEERVGGREEYEYLYMVDPPVSDAPSLPYSHIRHRTAIRRVLAGIQGDVDLQLDSANKIWTTSVIAQYFGINKFNCQAFFDYISTWIRAEPNFFFLEVNPEISLRIADAFLDHDIARDAYAILVGEEALDSIVRNRINPSERPAHSTFGRRKVDLPEALLERVEYASKAFAERNQNEFFQNVVGSDLKWIEDLSSVQALSKHSDLNQMRKIIVDLKEKLREWVRGSIYKVLLSSYWKVNTPENPHQSKPRVLLPQGDWADVWVKLEPEERVLTRTFWKALSALGISSGTTNWTLCDGWENENWKAKFYSNTPMKQKYYYTHQQVWKRELEETIRSGSREIALAIAKNQSREYPSKVSSLKGPKPLDDKTSLETDVKGSHQPASTSVEHTEPASIFPMEMENAADAEAATVLVNISKDPTPLSTWEQVKAENERTLNIFSVASPSTLFFDLDAFFAEASSFVKKLANRKLAPSDAGSDFRAEPYEPRLINTLTSLEPNEFKYLPLYAGGVDDGTGGVFSAEVDEAIPDVGFSTAGPQIHTGDSTYTSSTAGDFDSLSEISCGEAASSTFNTSMAVDDGYSDALPHRRKVYAASSVESGSSIGGAIHLDSLHIYEHENGQESNAHKRKHPNEHTQLKQAQSNTIHAALPLRGPLTKDDEEQAERAKVAKMQADAEDQRFYSDIFSTSDADEDNDFDACDDEYDDFDDDGSDAATEKADDHGEDVDMDTVRDEKETEKEGSESGVLVPQLKRDHDDEDDGFEHI